MTKGELLEKIKEYPDDIEIKIWDMINGDCNLNHIKECIDTEIKWSGTIAEPIKQIIKKPYIQIW
jgi:hypothetical protein